MARLKISGYIRQATQDLQQIMKTTGGVIDELQKREADQLVLSMLPDLRKGLAENFNNILTSSPASDYVRAWSDQDVSMGWTFDPEKMIGTVKNRYARDALAKQISQDKMQYTQNLMTNQYEYGRIERLTNMKKTNAAMMNDITLSLADRATYAYSLASSAMKDFRNPAEYQEYLNAVRSNIAYRSLSEAGNTLADNLLTAGAGYDGVEKINRTLDALIGNGYTFGGENYTYTKELTDTVKKEIKDRYIEALQIKKEVKEQAFIDFREKYHSSLLASTEDYLTAHQKSGVTIPGLRDLKDLLEGDYTGTAIPTATIQAYKDFIVKYPTSAVILLDDVKNRIDHVLDIERQNQTLLNQAGKQTAADWERAAYVMVANGSAPYIIEEHLKNGSQYPDEYRSFAEFWRKTKENDLNVYPGYGDAVSVISKAKNSKALLLRLADSGTDIAQRLKNGTITRVEADTMFEVLANELKRTKYEGDIGSFVELWASGVQEVFGGEDQYEAAMTAATDAEVDTLQDIARTNVRDAFMKLYGLKSEQVIMEVNSLTGAPTLYKLDANGKRERSRFEVTDYSSNGFTFTEITTIQEPHGSAAGAEKAVEPMTIETTVTVKEKTELEKVTEAINENKYPSIESIKVLMQAKKAKVDSGDILMAAMIKGIPNIKPPEYWMEEYGIYSSPPNQLYDALLKYYEKTYLPKMQPSGQVVPTTPGLPGGRVAPTTPPHGKRSSGGAH